MSSRLLTALNRLLATLVVIVLAWLAVCVVAMFTGHTDVLPGIGAVLVDLIDRLVTQPVHDLATRPDYVSRAPPSASHLRLAWRDQ